MKVALAIVLSMRKQHKWCRWIRLGLLGVGACASVAQAALPDYQAFPAQGGQRLLWVASERGRAEPEWQAAEKLAQQGIEVWSLDLLQSYFLPQLASSMDTIPPQDVADWLAAALASDKTVTVYAVARAAVPVLRAASRLAPGERQRLCVLLMYPNLYTVAEPLAAPAYLDTGTVPGLRVRILQPRRSAATPWLPDQMTHLTSLGAQVSLVMLENLREGYWARETPTAYEVAESQRIDAMLIHEMKVWGCQ